MSGAAKLLTSKSASGRLLYSTLYLPLPQLGRPTSKMISTKAAIALAAVAIVLGGDLAAIMQSEPAGRRSVVAKGGDEVDRLSIGGKIHISFCSS